jgi:hypothetical protein
MDFCHKDRGKADHSTTLSVGRHDHSHRGLDSPIWESQGAPLRISRKAEPLDASGDLKSHITSLYSDQFPPAAQRESSSSGRIHGGHCSFELPVLPRIKPARFPACFGFCRWLRRPILEYQSISLLLTATVLAPVSLYSLIN